MLLRRQASRRSSRGDAPWLCGVVVSEGLIHEFRRIGEVKRCGKRGGKGRGTSTSSLIAVIVGER